MSNLLQYESYGQCSKVGKKTSRWRSHVLSERPCHKEHICQTWKPYLFSSTKELWTMLKFIISRSWSRSYVENWWYCWVGKASSQGTHIPNMNALSFRTKKTMAMLKFFKSRSRPRSHVQNLCYHSCSTQRSKVCVSLFTCYSDLRVVVPNKSMIFGV